MELDTFEDGAYTDGPEDDSTFESDGGSTDGEEREEGQTDETASVQTEETESIDSDSQVNLLDEKEESGTKEEAKDTEKKSDKSDEEAKGSDEDSESKSDNKDDAGKNDGEIAADVRTIKAFSDGKQYEIPENAEIKTKVDGKWEKVTLTDLKDNYSGKVAYDEKFSSMNEERKAFSEERDTYAKEISGIKEHFVNIRQLTDAGMKGEVDPLSSVNYLLDLMGVNTLDYNKAMYNHMAEEFDIYSDMTENERESYWTKKENTYLVKKQESLTKNQGEQQAQAELNTRITNLRETHSVSEEDYVSAEQDLKAENFENITPEAVVEAARLKPLLSQADTAIEPYLDQLSDDEAYDLSIEIATTVFNNPNMSFDQVKRALAETYEVEDIVSEIEKKVGKAPEPYKTTSATSNYADLDMFED